MHVIRASCFVPHIKNEGQSHAQEPVSAMILFFLQKSSNIKLLPTISFIVLYHLGIAHYFLVLDFTLGQGTAVISFMVARQQTKNGC